MEGSECSKLAIDREWDSRKPRENEMNKCTYYLLANDRREGRKSLMIRKRTSIVSLGIDLLHLPRWDVMHLLRRHHWEYSGGSCKCRDWEIGKYHWAIAQCVRSIAWFSLHFPRRYRANTILESYSSTAAYVDSLESFNSHLSFSHVGIIPRVTELSCSVSKKEEWMYF